MCHVHEYDVSSRGKNDLEELQLSCVLQRQFSHVPYSAHGLQLGAVPLSVCSHWRPDRVASSLEVAPLPIEIQSDGRDRGWDMR